MWIYDSGLAKHNKNHKTTVKSCCFSDLFPICYCVHRVSIRVCLVFDNISCVLDTACRNKTSCACEYDCPTTSDWLCGDDGVSYINRCELNRMECETQQVIGVSDTGRCTQNSLDPCDSVVCGVGMRCKVDKRLEQPDCVCSNLCSANASEVCGSDGITYTNVCYMRALSCKRGDDVKMKKRGPCEVEPISKSSSHQTMRLSCAVTVVT